MHAPPLPADLRNHARHFFDRAVAAGDVRRPTHQPDAAVHLSQEQPTRVRGDVAAIKTGHYRPSLDRFKLKQLQATLCWHRGAPLDPIKS